MLCAGNEAGSPIAIELAVARIKLLSPRQLLSRLEHRLEVLTSGAQDLPTRKQTLRATLLWSYDLLCPREQRLFRLLSVFVGGCMLEAVEAVCLHQARVFIACPDCRLGSRQPAEL